MAANYTEHYQLNQWEPEDKVLRTDFNADNLKIDGAIKAEELARIEAVAALTEAVGKCGNCKIWSTSYIGNGRYGVDNPSRLTFPSLPLLVFVLGPGYGLLLSPLGSTTDLAFDSLGSAKCYSVNAAWSGTTVSWYNGAYPERQLNLSGTTYTVLAFFRADA